MEIDKVYHITTKSIAEYVIFNNETEYLRMKELIQYYQVEDPPLRFSYFAARRNDKNELVNKKRGITPSTAIRLSKYFGNSADYWMSLQYRWDLYHAMRYEKKVLSKIQSVQIG